MNGEFRNTVDEKGRLMLPAKLRDALSSGSMWLTRSTTGSLWLLTDEQFNGLVNALGTNPLSMMNRNQALIQRFVIAPARQVELDKTGRLAIPSFLREYAGIELKEECVVLCSPMQIEIMGAAKYDRELMSSLDLLADAGNSLSMMGGN